MKKEIIFKSCQTILLQRKKSIQEALTEIEESMQNETKSSLGDKHETARAKMQSEQEKLAKQMEELNKQINQLDKTDPKQTYNSCVFGALVTTNLSLFYLSIGLGKITIQNTEVMVISPLSPIGKCMLNLTEGDQFEFNQTKYSITSIQ